MTGFLAELFSLDGRVAVVTGGSSGIGGAMASALALAGAKVVLVARDPTRLSAAAASLCDAGCAAAWVSADPRTAAGNHRHPAVKREQLREEACHARLLTTHRASRETGVTGNVMNRNPRVRAKGPAGRRSG